MRIHAAGHDVHPTVTIEITGVEDHEVRRCRIDGAQRELLTAVVLEPSDGNSFGITPVREHAHHEHVEITVVVGVRRFRRVRPGKIADSMVDELESTPVLEPLHAVPWSWQRWNVVESVAVGIEDVDVTVLIQIRQRDAAAPEILISRAINDVGLEIASTVVLEDVDLLPR